MVNIDSPAADPEHFTTARVFLCKFTSARMQGKHHLPPFRGSVWIFRFKLVFIKTTNIFKNMSRIFKRFFWIILDPPFKLASSIVKKKLKQDKVVGLDPLNPLTNNYKLFCNAIINH